MLQLFDSILNRYTSYRVLLYSLCGLVAVGFVFALTGNVAVSAGGLVKNVAVLVAVSYGANRLAGRLGKVDTNNESWLITALILALILPTSSHLAKLLAVGLTALIAIASKFLLVWRHSQLFNPAAVAAVIMSVSGLLPATWWIGSPAMAGFTALAVCFVLRKQRKFSLFFAFALGSYAIFLIATHASGGQIDGSTLKTLILSWPLLFMGGVMLTEPSTLPASRYYQVLCGVLVGAIFTSQLHIGRVSTTPQVALIVGNIFSLIVSSRFAAQLVLKQQNQLAGNIRELVFDRPKTLRFLPGQYMEWTLAHAQTDSRGNRRSFSVASSPTENELRIAYKLYEPSSSFKKALRTLKPGGRLRAARPAGDFLLPADSNKPLIFIAGGIGITPFRSLIKYVVDNKQKRQITLFYRAQPDEIIYRELFDKAKISGVTTLYATERITTAAIQKAIASTQAPLIFISGPNAMVHHYISELKKIGVSQRQIRADYFSGY
jgi:ferredoxin-NADP reductase